MPDPQLYGQALVVALLTVAGLNLLARRVPLIRRSGRAAIVTRACAVGAAAAVGLAYAGLLPRVPPYNALDRLLVLLFPVTLFVECLLAALVSAPQSVRDAPSVGDVPPAPRPPGSFRERMSTHGPFVARLATALVAAPVLLYGSVYLQPGSNDWSPGRLILGILVSAVALLGTGELLGRIATRSALLYRTTMTCVGATILVAGMLVMMAGYIKGGATAFPLAGVWFGLALVKPTSEQSGFAFAAARRDVQLDVRVGVMCLFGLLFVGRFFGGLSSVTGVGLFLTPLVGWCAIVVVDKRPTTEGRSMNVSRVTALVYALLVAALLGVLFMRGYAQFRQKLGKLAGSVSPESVNHRVTEDTEKAPGSNRQRVPGSESGQTVRPDSLPLSLTPNPATAQYEPIGSEQDVTCDVEHILDHLLESQRPAEQLGRRRMGSVGSGKLSRRTPPQAHAAESCLMQTAVAVAVADCLVRSRWEYWRDHFSPSGTSRYRTWHALH